MRLAEWLDTQGEEVGLAFADVVRSTSLLFEEQTVRYADFIRLYRDRALTRARIHGGRIVDETGDQILAVFPDAGAAFRFGCDLFADTGHPDLKIRVGVHVGSVRAEGERLIGRNVHYCARVMQYARDAELWVSDAARRSMESGAKRSAPEFVWIANDETELKGIPGLHRLWRAA